MGRKKIFRYAFFRYLLMPDFSSHLTFLSTPLSNSRLYFSTLDAISEYFVPRIWQASIPAFLAPFIAIVATGTPGGI